MNDTGVVALQNAGSLLAQSGGSLLLQSRTPVPSVPLSAQVTGVGSLLLQDGTDLVVTQGG